MSKFELSMEEIASIVGGEPVVAVSAPQMPRITGVTTDSRKATAGDVFVALRGERFDGHDFVADAAEAGAVAAVVDHPVAAGVPQIVVADTLVALGKIAAWWRGQLDVTVVAVTGSAGKTTTKSMIASILERVGPTLSTPGTENNEIGVPLTLLRLEGERFCVLEMGARGLGHIAYLASIARPVIGVITNIGEAHLGLFGSVEKVAQAKGELLEALPEDGTAVLNAEDRAFANLCSRARCRVVSFGLRRGDFTARDIKLAPDGVIFRLCSPTGEVHIRLALPGRHNILNALAAAAAAWAAGAGIDEIADGLSEFRGQPMRVEVVRLADGITVINDAYNASPTSVRAALELLSGLAGRKVFVFGDMLELGEHAQRAHREVGRLAAGAGVSVLIAVGELAALAVDEAAQTGIEVHHVADADAAAAVVTKLVKPGDVVLVKASRLVGLERVVEALEEGRGCG